MITVTAGLGVVCSGAAADPDGGPASADAANAALVTSGWAALIACVLLGLWRLGHHGGRPRKTRPG
ncbi:hypothetical protein NKH77_35755 [Streptomyces sp. M19]